MTATHADLPPADAANIVRDGYVYGYPAVLMYTTIRQTTNYSTPTGIPTQGPFNQFTHSRAFVDASFRAVVRPNLDTLYSPASLDLAAEPLILTIPATDRYLLMPILSLWTDVFAVPGTRTTGTDEEQHYLLTSPDWHGEPPAGVTVIKSPTRYATLVGRTQTNGPSDYEQVHAIQRGYTLTPMSAWGSDSYTPPTHAPDPGIDMSTTPPTTVAAMNAAEYFGLLAHLMTDNPPQPCDYPMLHRLRRVGFQAGEFTFASLPSAVREAFVTGTAAGRERVQQLGRKESGRGAGGWVYTTRSGAYGVDYDYRAAVAYFALGENLPQDAIYPSLETDSDGDALRGQNSYRLHFAAGALPPADAFWSVTAYDPDGYLIPNKLNRYALGDRDALTTNADGSLDLWIQPDSPDAHRTPNWLPTSADGDFALMLRMYSPRDEALDRTWTPPLPSKLAPGTSGTDFA